MKFFMLVSFWDNMYVINFLGMIRILYGIQDPNCDPDGRIIMCGDCLNIFYSPDKW